MEGMRAQLAAAIVALAAAGTAAAAYPKADVQYANKTMKASFTTWAKKNLRGTTVGKVACVLPTSGNVIHCTIHVSAPKNRENILFKVKGTLQETGKLAWVATSHSCADSKTGKKFPC
jgi:TctA family transporter